MGDFPFQRSDAEYKEMLTPMEFRVLRQGGTEPPTKGEFCAFFPKAGYFACKTCRLPLYPSASKFKDCGWDAYDRCFYTGDRCHVTGVGPKHHLEVALLPRSRIRWQL